MSNLYIVCNTYLTFYYSCWTVGIIPISTEIDDENNTQVFYGI